MLYYKKYVYSIYLYAFIQCLIDTYSTNCMDFFLQGRTSIFIINTYKIFHQTYYINLINTKKEGCNDTIINSPIICLIKSKSSGGPFGEFYFVKYAFVKYAFVNIL